MARVIYDIEVFEQMNMAGFLKEDKSFVVINAVGFSKNLEYRMNDTIIYINNFTKNRECFKLLNGIYGFNNRNYDDFLIEDILLNRDFKYIKQKSDAIIKTKPYQNFTWYSYDIREQLPLGLSLKKYESQKGLSVMESSIPFDYTGVFDLDMIKETVKYNVQDLKASQAMLDDRKNYFDSKDILVDKYGWNGSQRYTNGTITASYLMGRNKLEYFKPTCSKIYGVSEEAKNFLQNAKIASPKVSRGTTKTIRQKMKSQEWSEYVEERHGCIYTWGWGGLHAAKGHLKKTAKTTRKVYESVDESNVIQIDVTSMFPFIMIRDKLLGEATEKFKNLVHDRIKNKRKGLPIQQAQKIIINAVYGLLRLQTSKLYNPLSAIFVNIGGMVAIFNLADRVDKIGQIIQVNTDAVTMKLRKGHTENEVKEIIKEWEDEFKLNLEVDHFDRFIQKDVNNYIAIHDEVKNSSKEIFTNKDIFKKEAKNIKLKGGKLTQAFYIDSLKASKPTILDRALTAYLIDGTDPIEILKTGKLRDFCFTITSQRGKTQTGYTVDSNGKRLDNKVNRVYASEIGQQYFKEKVDASPAKFPNVPEFTWLVNEDILNEDIPNDLDLTFYKELVLSDVKKWNKNKVA